jgi:hypothetical protein
MAIHDRNFKGNKVFGYIIAVPVAALMIAAVMTVYDVYRHAQVKRAHRLATTANYIAAQSASFCVLEGIWHNWEEDETIELGCLRMRGIAREGSYRSAMGPRSTSNLSITGTYDLDADDAMLVVGTSHEGKQVKFNKTIHVDDTEYPTQMILIDEKGDRGVYIWKRKE